MTIFVFIKTYELCCLLCVIFFGFCLGQLKKLSRCCTSSIGVKGKVWRINPLCFFWSLWKDQVENILTEMFRAGVKKPSP